jgi:hypothetical protein
MARAGHERTRGLDRGLQWIGRGYPFRGAGSGGGGGGCGLRLLRIGDAPHPTALLGADALPLFPSHQP